MGSALATVLGWACSCLAVLQYFCLRSDVPMRLRLPAMRLSFSMDRTILAFGLPSFCVQAGMAIVNFVINFQLVRYGALTPIGADDALAAIGVVQRIGQFSVMPLIGIAIALQPLLGFNYGATTSIASQDAVVRHRGASSISVLMFIIVMMMFMFLMFVMMFMLLMLHLSFAISFSLYLLNPTSRCSYSLQSTYGIHD